MKSIKARVILHVLYIIAGIALLVIPIMAGATDDFWMGLAAGFIVIGAMRLIQIGRFQTNKEYAKKVTVKQNDERNKYLSEKASAFSFKCSVLTAAFLSIVLYLLELKDTAIILGYVTCGQLIIYLIGYYIFRKKY